MKLEEASFALDLITLDRNLYLGKYGQSIRNLENVSKGSSAVGLMAGILGASVLSTGGIAGTILRKFAGNKALLKKVEQYASGLTKNQARQFWKKVDDAIGNQHIKNIIKWGNDYEIQYSL